ncbi:endonuclease/exonuclease/phosphatase family metal-dependent hydrolase [Lewinella aquimaris]|uniref:Endonuclease/exonuclease/phosphatase family metal-dependent hydrolase n=1 Tax=Neolewinella aquimaris TaxID=1835722 RepID=A0A840EDN8_9BACT|nr:endonuclease/exonuclease/phosphatase family protein [Neolewinella aquimaris]MBB4080078.1 endonuclease/exonuclease/phosphatase family metal-dependent hydrolase [Neolewinella aquimaris]
MRTIILWIGNLVTFVTAFGLMARYVPPQTFWPPAIVALLLPGLLLVTLFFFLSCLSRFNWRAALFPLVVLLFSIPLLGHLLAFPSSSPLMDDTDPTLTLVTANVRAFRSVDGTDADTFQVREVVDQFGADLLLMQEVRTLRYRLNYISLILDSGGFRERHQKEGTVIATYGNDITPVTASFTPPNEYNGYVVTDVATKLGPLRIINAHLESNQISRMTSGMSDDNSVTKRVETFSEMLRGYGRATRTRARQAEAIRKIVEDSPHPVILAGDFNDVPSSYTYNHILSPRLRDAWSERGTGLGTTFTGPLPGLRIDYFMVDTSLNVLEIERLPSRWSDHRPLRITLAR